MQKQPTPLFEALKACKDCESVLPTAEFYAYKAGHLYSRCKACHYIRTRQWVTENREFVNARDRYRYHHNGYRERQRAKRRMAKYGIAPAEYDAMLERQGHVCPICLRPFLDTSQSGDWDIASVDHNHETGRVRGILHRRCNLALEFMLPEDDLDRAKRYLERDTSSE